MLAESFIRTLVLYVPRLLVAKAGPWCDMTGEFMAGIQCVRDSWVLKDESYFLRVLTKSIRWLCCEYIYCYVYTVYRYTIESLQITHNNRCKFLAKEMYTCCTSIFSSFTYFK